MLRGEVDLQQKTTGVPGVSSCWICIMSIFLKYIYIFTYSYIAVKQMKTHNNMIYSVYIYIHCIFVFLSSFGHVHMQHLITNIFFTTRVAAKSPISKVQPYL